MDREVALPRRDHVSAVNTISGAGRTSGPHTFQLRFSRARLFQCIQKSRKGLCRQTHELSLGERLQDVRCTSDGSRLKGRHSSCLSCCVPSQTLPVLFSAFSPSCRRYCGHRRHPQSMFDYMSGLRQLKRALMLDPTNAVVTARATKNGRANERGLLRKEDGAACHMRTCTSAGYPADPAPWQLRIRSDAFSVPVIKRCPPPR